MFGSDPLVPARSLLPLAETRSGGYRPVDHVPGPLRPFSATLAVVPVQCGKHDTTESKWEETKETQESKDGEVVPDSVVEIKTDT